jgi:hypothetical protein
MRIIGTNSARATKASQKLNEIENFISMLRKKHSHLNDKYIRLATKSLRFFQKF